MIKRGDSVILGRKFCEESGYLEYTGEITPLTPQYFECENGLYTYWEECPGIIDDGEPESIYHLFGNNFERLMDCVVVKGGEEEFKLYDRILMGHEVYPM